MAVATDILCLEAKCLLYTQQHSVLWQNTDWPLSFSQFVCGQNPAETPTLDPHCLCPGSVFVLNHSDEWLHVNNTLISDLDSCCWSHTLYASRV